MNWIRDFLATGCLVAAIFLVSVSTSAQGPPGSSTATKSDAATASNSRSDEQSFKADDLTRIKQLAEDLQSVDLKRRRDAAYELASLGHQALPALDPLIGGLKDLDQQVWTQSAMAIARIGHDAAAATPTLIENLDSRDAQQRYRAAWVLANIGTPAIPSLTAATSDASPRRREAVAQAFGQVKAPIESVIGPLQKLLDDESSDVRIAAANALVQQYQYALNHRTDNSNTARSDRETGAGPVDSASSSTDAQHVRDALARALDLSDPNVRAIALRGIAARRVDDTKPLPQAITEQIRRCLDDPNPTVRAAAIEALPLVIGQPDAISQSLATAATDDHPDPRSAVVVVLHKYPMLIEPTIHRLINLVQDGNPSQRLRIVRTLGLIGPKASAAIDPLVASLKTESDEIRETIAWAISRIGPSAVPALMEASQDPDQSSIHIAKALSGMGASAVEPLMDALQDDAVAVRINAAQALAEFDPLPRQAVALLSAGLQDDNESLRRACIAAIGNATQLDEAVRVQLRQAAQDESPVVRAESVHALAETAVDRSSIAPLLIKALQDPDDVVRIRALQGLRGWKEEARVATNSILEALAEPNPMLRAEAIDTLIAMQQTNLIPDARLFELLADESPRVRQAAADAITAMNVSGKSLAKSDEVENVTRHDPKALAAALIELLTAEDDSVVRSALDALASLGTDANTAIDRVLQLQSHANPAIRAAVANCLTSINIDDPRTVPRLIELLQDEEWTVRREAAGALGRIGSPRANSAIPYLFQLMDNEQDYDAARGAIRTIDDADPDAVPALIEALESEDRRKRFYSARLLGKIGPAANAAIPHLEAAIRQSTSSRFTSELESALKSIRAAP